MKAIDLNDLYLFAQTVDAGGFSAAARATGIPKATISRRIAQLEKRLGVTLIQRNTHQFQVTYVGQRYYRHCAALITEAEAAEQVIQLYASEPRGTVKLSCPKELLDLYVNDMLIPFMQRYPDIVLEVESTNRRVDVLQERFDFAIRVRPWPLPDSDLVVRPFVHSRMVLVASPRLIAQPLEDPNAVLSYPSLSNQDDNHHWRLQHSAGEERLISHQPRLSTENIYLLREAAVNGLGIVALPGISVLHQMRTGQLQRVLSEDWQMDCGMIHAAYPTRRGMLPAVKALLDFLSEAFRASGIE
ncbi:MAG: LysR substrate-binding domain-containing protein [Lautropia sp.]|nr:LysR substrate-binding domain-containing protein [Lautropia sp.]